MLGQALMTQSQTSLAYETIALSKTKTDTAPIITLMQQEQDTINNDLALLNSLIDHTAIIKNEGLIAEIRSAARTVEALKSLTYGCPSQ